MVCTSLAALVTEKKRRHGARQADLPPALAAALQEERDRLAQVPDPQERIRLVGDFFAALDGPLAGIAQVRLDAVKELRRQGWTYEKLRDISGLSKSRVAQLSRLVAPAKDAERQQARPRGGRASD